MVLWAREEEGYVYEKCCIVAGNTVAKSYTHTHTHTLSLSLSLSHSHIYTHITHTHIHTHTHTHTFITCLRKKRKKAMIPANSS